MLEPLLQLAPHVCVCVCVEGGGEDAQISKAQLRLTDIAEHLESDWLPLATQLNITPDDVTQIQHDYQYTVEQVTTSISRHRSRFIVCLLSTSTLSQ